MDAAATLKLSTTAAALLTPLIITVIAKAFPTRPSASERSAASLRRRNSKIDGLATIFMLLGLILPFILFGHGHNRLGWLPIGLAFGLSVSCHFVWVCLATLPFGGLRRFREFWRFYEMRWGVAMTVIRAVYLPIAFIGLYSAFEIWT